jgi:hypothetical protein
VLKSQNAALVQDSRRVADDNMRLQAELHAARDPLEEQQQQQQEEGKARPKQRGSSQQPFSGGEKLGEGGASESGDGNSSASDLKGRAVAAALLDQFSKLEREYDNYRAHAQRLFQDKDDAVATLEARLRQAQSGTAAATTVALLTPRAFHTCCRQLIVTQQHNTSAARASRRAARASCRGRSCRGGRSGVNRVALTPLEPLLWARMSALRAGAQSSRGGAPGLVQKQFGSRARGFPRCVVAALSAARRTARCGKPASSHSWSLAGEERVALPAS